MQRHHRTAGQWSKTQRAYFERILTQMSALPFTDDTFDWALCREVLHHNDRRGMTVLCARSIACCKQAGAR